MTFQLDGSLIIVIIYLGLFMNIQKPLNAIITNGYEVENMGKKK